MTFPALNLHNTRSQNALSYSFRKTKGFPDQVHSNKEQK